MVNANRIKSVAATGQIHGGPLTGPAVQADFRPAVYWFWHQLPLPDEVENQLKTIKKAGYGAVLIQPRLAFPRDEYLGERYLEAYRIAMDRVRELDLEAGLYDDYNWISGHAGGRTVETNDSLRERHLFWTSAIIGQEVVELTVSGIRSRLVEGLGTATGEWLYEGGNPRWADWTLITALACRPAEDPCQPTGPVVDMTDRGWIDSASPDSCRLCFHRPPDLPADMRLTAFVSARCGNSRLINYLHPEAGQSFIQAGYEPYYKALAEYFGNPLTFLFFDQPYSGFYSWQERSGNVLNSLMFDEGLAAAFEAEHQTPLSQALLALTLPESVDTPRLRCNFFDTYGRLARRYFFEPVCQWAEDKGLAATGHELLSFIGSWGFAGGLPELDSRVNFGADYFAVDAYKTHSAVDACNYHAQLSARFGASLAKSHHRRGCLVEQYSVARDADPSPAGRWDLTLEELRAQSIRHVFQGASRVMFHGFYQTDGWADDPTLLANPRLDFPPGINFEPWFSSHLDSARELDGLASYLAGAEEFVPVAVLYPLRTYWHAGPEHPFSVESAWWHRWLTEHGYAYDIVDESQLLAGDLSLRSVNSGPAGYQILILPGVEIVADQSFVDQLVRFVTAGGRVIASGPLPLGSQATGRDRELADRVLAFFSDSERAVHLPSVTNAKDSESQVDRWLAEAVSSPVRFKHSGCTAGPLWTWAGREGGGWRLAMFNDSREGRRVEIEVQGCGLIPELRPLDGSRTKDWGWFEWTASKTLAWVDLPPNGLTCIRFRPAEPCLPQRPRLEKVSRRAGQGWAYRTGADGLKARFTSHRQGRVVFEVVSQKEPMVDAPAAILQIDSLAQGRWAVSIDPGPMPKPVELSSNWTFRPDEKKEGRPIDVRFGWEVLQPTYSGVGWYDTLFHLPSCAAGLGWELVLPKVVATAKCYLNGTLVGQRGWPPFNFALPPEMLKRRANRLRLEIANTAANRYCTETPYPKGSAMASGLIGAPQLRPVVRIELTV